MHLSTMKTRIFLAAPLLATILFATAAFAQMDPTFTPSSLDLTGLKLTVHLTITSPYDDCTMAITATVNPPKLATITPPGPVVSTDPVTFTITTGTIAGSGSVVFNISSQPSGCVLKPLYNIPLTVKDVPGGTTPRLPAYAKQVMEPIDTSNGAYLNTYTDLRLRGPLPITFERYYDSSLSGDSQAPTSALGTNWQHNYDRSISVSGSTATVYWDSGQAIQFTNSAGTWSNSSNDPLGYQLQASGTTYQMLNPGSNLIYTFDGSSGHLTSIKDRRGNSQTLTYTNNQLTHVADGLGATLDFTYSGSNLTKVTDQSGRSISFAYTGGALTSFVDAGGKSTAYAYTGAGLMTSYTLPRGNTPYTQTYNTANQVATQKDAAGNLFQFSYAAAQGISTMSDPLSGVSTYTHSFGSLTQEVDPLKDTSTYSYSSLNQLTSAKDAAGRTTSYTYNPGGLVASTTFPDGGRITYTYTSNVSGGFTYYDLTSITRQDGGIDNFTYDSAGNVTSRTDGVGQVWRTSYDAHGLPTIVTGPDGSKTTYTYSTDGAETLISVQYATGATNNIKVDSLKRITARTHSDGTSYSYTYDNYDHVLTEEDELGGITTYTYDANGNAATITDANGGVTTITRTGTDKTSVITDGAGRTLTLKYDSLDRPVVLQYGDSSAFTTGFDAAGNITSLTDGAGMQWKAGYDASGAQTSFTNPLGNKMAYGLDPNGNITTITTPASRATAFAYDRVGNLTSITDPLQKATTYAYDKNGRLTGTTAPLSLAVTYGRNAIGAISSLTDAGRQPVEIHLRWGRPVADLRRSAGEDADVHARCPRQHQQGSDPDRHAYDEVGCAVVTYAYDKAGNLLSRTLPGTTPAISAGGLVNSGSYSAPLVRGELASLFGTNLANTTAGAGTLPLPTVLAGVQITVGGVPAAIYYVSPTQINFQVPFEAPVTGGAQVIVSNYGTASAAATVAMAEYAPGIFTYARTATVLDPIVVHGADNSLVTPSNPASANETLVLYLTGAGTFDSTPADGAPASGSPLSNTKVTATVTVGGSNAPVGFSGLTPGNVGLLQINFNVPAAAAGGGALPMMVSFGAASSAPANLYVK